MVISKLDRIVSTIKGGEEKAYSSDPVAGIALLDDEGIRFSKAPQEEGIFMAWHKDVPELCILASNGLRAGCYVYILRNLQEIK